MADAVAPGLVPGLAEDLDRLVDEAFVVEAAGEGGAGQGEFLGGHVLRGAAEGPVRASGAYAQLRQQRVEPVVSLWTEEGRILWLLGQVEKESLPLTVGEIADRLKRRTPVVLHRLRSATKVMVWPAGRRELWGTRGLG